MKRHVTVCLLLLCIFAFPARAFWEDLQTFCAQTCALWPKMCATGTACVKLCKTPQRILKGCHNNKVPVDTRMPDVGMSKPQFCQSMCGQPPLVCAAVTYCIQSCGTPSAMMRTCIEKGIPVDTRQPQIIG